MQQHKKLLRTIVSSEIRHVRHGIKHADTVARQQLQEAAGRAAADLKAALGSSWLAAVLDEQQGQSASVSSLDEHKWRQEL